mgnify:FL=1
MKLSERNKTISELENELLQVKCEYTVQSNKLESFCSNFYQKIIKEKYLIDGIKTMSREV